MFKSSNIFLYEDGTPVLEGDAVLSSYGMFPAVVSGFLNGDTFCVLLDEGGSGLRPVNYDNYKKGFLIFVKRNSKNCIKDCIEFLEGKQAEGDDRSPFVLGNIYYTGN